MFRTLLKEVRQKDIKPDSILSNSSTAAEFAHFYYTYTILKKHEQSKGNNDSIARKIPMATHAHRG